MMELPSQDPDILLLLKVLRFSFENPICLMMEYYQILLPMGSRFSLSSTGT